MGNWAGERERQASLGRQIVFVVEKQFVIHLQTRHRNTDFGCMTAEVGDQTADP